MNGGQDLGGMMGFGPVVPEPDEPIFHAAWERRAFAITLAMGATGEWTLDMARSARENRPAGEYLAMSYYQIWLAGLEQLLSERGLVGEDEIRAGRSLRQSRPVRRVLRAGDVAETLARGGPTERLATAEPNFRVGDWVTARLMHPEGHTRIPRYVRGRPGVIEAVHGVHVFADSNATPAGESPTFLYGVAFRGPDLWGPDCEPSLTVRVDLWEPHLEPR